MGIALTLDGHPIRCDGCGAYIEEVRPENQHPMPRALAVAVYGRAMTYVVCEPLPRPATDPPGVHRTNCLDMAVIADQVFEALQCRSADCDGNCPGFPQ